MPRGPKSKRDLVPWAARLRAAIEASGRFDSRADFLRKLGHEPSTIYRYEMGDRQPPLDLLREFAAALGVSVGELLGEERDEGDERGDTRGWASFVSRGYLDFFRARGVTAEQIEHGRRTPFRGGPGVSDYVRIFESMLREAAPNEAPEMPEARGSNLADGTPSGRKFVPDK